jgi:hypothetical protein
MFDDDQEMLSALASFAEAVEGSVTNENNNLADSIASLEGDELGIPTPSLPPMNLPPLANNTSPEVTKEMKEKYEPEFAFSCFVPIHPTVRAGYKTPPSPAEWKAISEMKAGIGYTPRGQYYGKVSRQKMVNAFHGEEKRGVEHLLTLECKCAACRCLKKICRIDGGILCYENIDLSSGEPFEHTGHEISKEEQKKFRNPNQAGGNSRKQATKSKYDELSLTEIHHEFIRTFGMGEVSKGSWYDLAQAMKDSPECRLTPAQENNLSGLASRIKDYVKRRKRAKDPNFVKWGKQPMTGLLGSPISMLFTAAFGFWIISRR